MTDLITFKVAGDWLALMREMGAKPAPLFKHAQLAPDLLQREDAHLSITDYFRLWHSLAALTTREDAPLKAARSVSTTHFSPAQFACFCSADLNHGLRRLAQYQKLQGPLRLVPEITADHTRVSIECLATHEPVPFALGMTELVLITQRVRLATGSPVTPSRVELPQLPEATSPFEAFFGCIPSQGAHFAVTFRQQDAAKPFVVATETMKKAEGMWRFFDALQVSPQALNNSGYGLTEQVRAALLLMLPSGRCAIDDAAALLDLNKRTLQRKLEEQGQHFQHLLNQLRRDLACHYLIHSAYTLAEVAFLLDFQDIHSFIRAFRSWTGTTPGEYRLSGGWWQSSALPV
ncbi:AraC family transcriptional regulator ligand-binding domain-containing protein [Pokkaliibacter sp. MBI-7]|uniref:AraC family transcriptional regulator n=1 Tax=Pokkaliibacter sp. MBI-7 TaxID=3040600 RepID=UPI00244B9EC2|nr:AraC family transcriptional regulator [Pokkaliibacter sp. MBI-7]MDH2435917.1 AraC family transcriptional regulator ligand-binding domain-containing protein [Pokkaliibacter sp. MBI-7]